MDKIIEVLKQAIEVKIGLVCIVIAIVVGVFKQHWLIAGVNTMSKKELAKIDLDYLTKYFGLFFAIFGLLMMLSPFLLDFLNLNEHRYLIMTVGTLLFCIFLILWLNVIKKDRIYNK